VKRCPSCGRTYSEHERFCSVDGETLDLWAGADPLIGCRIADRYRVAEPIGEGGMGTVYRAWDEDAEREVALKLLRADRLGSPRAAQRLLREAGILETLDGPGTVRLFGYGELPGGRVYLAMERLVGRTLKDALRLEGRMPPARAIDLALDICEPVANAHDQGLVHRDLKPSNVFLEQGQPEVVRVLDFGIATHVEADAELSRLTGSGDIPGTPGYVAPEVIAGGEASPRADVYAIGLILYELLSGRPVHRGSTSWQVLATQLQADVPPLDVPGVGPGLVALVARCTARDPSLRPVDAGALADALARVETAGQEPIDATQDDVSFDPAQAAHPTGSRVTPLPTTPSKGSRLPLGMVMGAVLLIAIAVGWMMREPGDTSAPPSPEPAAIGRRALPATRAAETAERSGRRRSADPPTIRRRLAQIESGLGPRPVEAATASVTTRVNRGRPPRDGPRKNRATRVDDRPESPKDERVHEKIDALLD